MLYRSADTSSLDTPSEGDSSRHKSPPDKNTPSSSANNRPPRSLWRIIALFAAGLAVVGILSFYLREPDVGPFVGNRLPEFALMNRQGELVRGSELTGRPLLINFWATWCEPCRAEMPEIEKVYVAAAGAFDVIAVTDEPLTVAERFFTDLDLNLPLYIDADRSMFEELLIRFMPTTYFVDGSGIIRSIWVGQLNEEQLLHHIEGIVSHDEYARLTARL